MAVVAAACAHRTAGKLSPVAAAPAPALPAWIGSVSPTGAADSLAQVRVLFAKPVVRVEALSGDGPRAVLDHIAIEPPLSGHFAVLTPRMIGFVPDQALPVGTRVRVTLRAGLRDLAGDVLASDVAWTFETHALSFDGLPKSVASGDESTPPPVGLRPKIPVTANAAVDAASLSQRATLVGGDDSVPLDAQLEATPSPEPGNGAAEAFDPSLKDWVYDLKPRRDLSGGRTYTLRIAPGVEPSYGNLPTADAFTGSIRTYGPLAILPTPAPNAGTAGRFAGGDPAIVFNNPIDPKSVAGAIAVSPAPANVKTLTQLSDDGTLLAIDPYALDANATYAVTVSPKLKDVFGQTLDKAQTVSVRTGNFAPGAWAPSGVSVIPAGLPVSLNFYATNLPNNAYRAAYARVPPEHLFAYPDPLTDLPLPASWPQQRLVNARDNAQSAVAVPLQQRIGAPFGALAYGFRTALDAADSPPSLVGIAQLTNLGAFAEFFPDRGRVMVQHLSDGAPARGVAVTVYRNVDASAAPHASPAPCARAATDADGEADFGGVDLERCYAAPSGSEAPTVGIIASEGTDTAVLTLFGNSGLYRFDANPGWSAGAPLSRGTIFSDRQMYQPGERAQLTGVAYYVQGARVVADRNATYRVTLTDPSNAATHLPNVKTDRYGIFTLPLAFAAQQALGYYTLDAKGSSGNEISGSLRVAEFKPPNFKLGLALSATSAQAGHNVHADATAAYLFGAPLQDGRAHAYVTRQSTVVQPKGWDDFSFGRQWFWPEQQPAVDSDVLQRDFPLDADGKGNFDVTVPADLPFPMTYTVDVEASDVSNLSVSDSQQFLALPADAAIGLATDTVAVAGKPLSVRTIVADASGHAISGRALHLELQKMTYTSATQQTEGGENAQEAIEYQTVASADATSGAAPVSVALTPTDSGPYRLRANFAGTRNDASATDVQIFALGSGEADWGAPDTTVVTLKLDKKRYAIGDVANLLIASPFDRSDVYLSVVRGGELYRRTLRDVRGAARASFRVTSDMLPNAAVQAVVVRRGGNLATVKSGKLDSLARTGVAAFGVDLRDRYLKLQVSPQAAKAAPGARQQVSFALTRGNGNGTGGEIVAMAVNDAILQLSGYRLPDLVTTVFADQPISELLGDSRDAVVLKTQTPPLEKGFGYGGGYLAGAAGTRVRQEFLPLAWYGVIKTDPSGHASASFTLPDDLTTWRVMAVAVGDDDAHFATSDATFVTSLPVMANPLLPQFARTGDAFDVGVSLSNQTGASGALDLVLRLSGALRFAEGDPKTLHASKTAAAGMQAFRFPVVAGTPAPTTLQAAAAVGNDRDAFTVPVTVGDRATTESVIDGGVVTDAGATISVKLQGGTVQVTLANSVVPQFAAPSSDVMSGEGLPLADQTAARLTIAAALLPLQKPYRLSLAFDPAAQRAKQVRALLGFQRGDGGYGETSDARDSDPFASAYALDALAFARAGGASVDSGALGRGKAFAAAVLANPGRFKWCANDAGCKARLRFAMLWALAQNGDRRTDFLGDVVRASGDFDSATQIQLARYLLATPGWQGQGGAMAGRLVQNLYLTGRYATQNVNSRWSWLGSTVRAQAQMLQLLIERHAPTDRLDGAVRALMAQRCNCGWPTADDTADALTALSAYAKQERPAPAHATVTANGATVASADFGSTAGSRTVSIAAPAIRGDALVLRARGRVHYTLLYTYPVPPDAPGQLAAFRVQRVVTAPSSTAAPLATMDLAPAPRVDVNPGDVFDVGVRVIVDHPVDRFAIDDPLPAGFEAVDTTFRTTLQAVLPRSDSWQIDAQQIYRDRVVAYAAHLDPGIYELHYLVRSVTPGRFAWPGARAYLLDAPEQFGRSAAATLHVNGGAETAR